jgi:GntR family transcriptional repressor for pyruvate dehydrogenase complex
MNSLTGEVRRVADVILSRVIEGTYPCGLRLPAESALAEELSCGRSTIREALRHLADQGLLRSRRGSGTMVLDFRREGTPALLPAYIRAGTFERPPLVIAREMLRLRTVMAVEATRLAARYADHDSLADARDILTRAPALECDPAGHALNELDFYRALVFGSAIWPAAWLVNAFWAPLREVNSLIAPAIGVVNPAFQTTMVELLELVENGHEEQAVGLVTQWFEAVDLDLVAVLETALKNA